MDEILLDAVDKGEYQDFESYQEDMESFKFEDLFTSQ